MSSTPGNSPLQTIGDPPPLVRVLAHRGASADRPENTIEAFVEAAGQGADGVELDVRSTVDGALVVHHDAHLGDGRAIAETRRGDIPGSVATLGAALEACAPMMVNVEIKHDESEPGFHAERRLADQVVSLVAAMRNAPPVLYSSFDPATIDRVRQLDPEAATGLLVVSATEPIDALDAAVRAGHAAVHPNDWFVDEALVERCHASGLAINVWTVDNPERILQLAGWGVDAIITNRPGVAREVLRAAGLGGPA